MLETLVAPRIRRTLLEHIVTHPAERFYLRGLAKSLQLSVSPLRRELLRLEGLGLLTAYDEANVRFYEVEQSSPLFQQLHSAVQATHREPPELLQPSARPTDVGHEDRVGDRLSAIGREVDSPLPKAVTHNVTDSRHPSSTASAPEPLASVTVISRHTAERWQRWNPRLSWTAVGVGMMLAVMVGAVGYTIVSFRQLMSLASSAVRAPRNHVTVVQSDQTASGVMQSARWRLLPGAIGSGFSAGTSGESY